MLSQISWGQFWGWLGVLTVLHWVVVISVYYRRELFSLGTPSRNAGVAKRDPAPSAKPLLNTYQTAFKQPSTASSPLFSAVHELMEALKPVFQEAMEERVSKPALLQALQELLVEFRALNGSEFEAAIVDHIVLQSRERCGIILEAREIWAIWNE
jgi:hypothetical protein